MRRFPPRTLLLMALALAAFIRFYYVTHQAPPAPPPHRASTPGKQAPALPAHEEGSPPGTQACRTLDRTLEAVVRTPEDPAVLTRARAQLDACPQLPQRACELGAALDVRASLDAGTAPAREVLDVLCQRCPGGTNPCTEQVSRSLLAQLAGTPVDAARLRWDVEHAAHGQPEACAAVVRFLLAPAALATDPLPTPRQEVLAQLAPVCAQAGQLPASILHAAVVQGDVPALAPLVHATPAPEAGVLKPDRLVGPPGGDKAFDGQASTGIELTTAPDSPRWRKDGALSALFEPPVHQLTALRVRAQGPGSLRAVVRVEGNLGLSDPDHQTAFVLPVACHFRGTGQWETCTLPVALLEVEALGVFPDKRSLVLTDVEARGIR